MSDEEFIRRKFEEALEQAKLQAQGEATLIPVNIALAKCWEWIHSTGATTGSARTLRAVIERHQIRMAEKEM
jgi:hypothetical protein